MKPIIANLILSSMAHVHAFEQDFKVEQPKPYGEIERSGKSRKSDRKRAPKWGRRC